MKSVIRVAAEYISELSSWWTSAILSVCCFTLSSAWDIVFLHRNQLILHTVLLRHLATKDLKKMWKKKNKNKNKKNKNKKKKSYSLWSEANSPDIGNLQQRLERLV